MSDHLPECPSLIHTPAPCICDRLRACEQRVLREAPPVFVKLSDITLINEIRNEQFAKGVQAAREAVAGMLLVDPNPAWDGIVRVCLEQIDALREADRG